MRPGRRQVRSILAGAVVFPLAFILLSPANALCDYNFDRSPKSKGKKGPTAVVYVIDKSSSMAWIFGDLKRTLKAVIDECEPEDRVSIILCGDTVTTLARYKTMGKARKKKLKRLIDSISPEGLHTNLAPAIRRAVEYLHDYSKDGSVESYALVLVTDGKDNPAPGSPRDITIEGALTQFSKFHPGRQWGLNYIALKGSIDPEMLALVKKYGGGVYDVASISRETNLSEGQVIGSILEDLEAWMAGAEIVDGVGDVKIRRYGSMRWETMREGEARELVAGDSVATTRGSRALIRFGPIGRLGLEEKTEVLLEELQRFDANRMVIVHLALKDGVLWNAVGVPPNAKVDYTITTPIANVSIKGTILRVALDRKTRVISSAILSGSAEISSRGLGTGFERYTLETDRYSIITPGESPAEPSPIIREQPTVIPLHETITLGPLEPEGAYTAECPIVFNRNHHEILFEWNSWEKVLMKGQKLSDVDFEGVSVDIVETAIDLPAGAAVSMEIQDSTESRLEKNLSITIECAKSFEYESSEERLGAIKLAAGNASTKLERSTINVKIPPPPPTPPILYILIGVAVLAVSIVSGRIIIKKSKTAQRVKVKVFNYIRGKVVKTKLIKPFRARPCGKLVVQKTPDGDATQSLDLAEISRRSDKVILEIGADAENSIPLSHSSVHPHHCAIWASRKRFPTRIYIEADEESGVIVNKEPVNGPRQLADKDLVDIGEYRFEFVDTQFHRQVEVHMQDGTVHEGILAYWDVGQSVFYMSKTSKEKEEFLALRFMDIAFAHFRRDESARELRAWGTRPSVLKRKKLVVVTLRNRKQLKGFVHKKHRLGRELPGIFLLPISQSTEIQHTYIPRTSIDSLTTLNFRGTAAGP